MHSDSSLTYAQIYCKNINKLIAVAKSEYAAFEILDTEIARLRCFLDEEVRELRDVYEDLAKAESELEIRDSRIKELEEFIRANARCGCFWHIDASTDPAVKKRHLCAKCALNV